MTSRSGDWLKNNFMERDPYDYNVDLIDSMGLWTDTLTVGEDGDGDDVLFYGDTSGSQLHWDADTDTLELDGTTPKFRLGDFSGATAGSGSVLSASNTASFRVYCDDGGAAIGSGTLARAGVFRNLLTYTGGNREQEAAGVIGQVVSVAGTNRHNMAGTWGSYEARTSLTVDGQAAATDTWAQAAIIARVGVGSGITTINANGVLAGVAAMSNTASFAANNGVYAAYYAGAWAGTVDWAYGMYLEGGKFTTGIAIGECTDGITIGTCTDGITITGATGYALDIQTSGQLRMGIQGTGIPTVSATPFAMEIHSETGEALTAGLTGRSCGIRSRYEISVAQPNQISLSAVEGRLRVKANIADGEHSGVSGSIESDGAITYTGTSTTQWNAGTFCIELGSTCVFTGASGWLTGVTIDSSIHATQTDIANITYPALRIKTSTSKLPWQYGLYTGTDEVSTGIYMRPAVMGIDSDVTAVASGSYGHKFIGRTITKSDGAAGYFEGHASGTTTGAIYGLGAWLNVDSGTHANGLYGLDVGVWGDDATYTSSYVCAAAFYTHVCNDTAAPSNHYMLRFNTDASEDTPDAWFHSANPQAVACTDNADATGSKVAAIKINITGSNADPGYIWVYDSTGA